MKPIRGLLVVAAFLLILVLIQSALAAETYGYITKWRIINNPTDNPTGIAADQSGNIYVADDETFTIQEFSSNGTYVMSLGSPGIGTGFFRGLSGITVDSQGFVYVLDKYTVKVLKYGSDGTFLSEWEIGEPGDSLSYQAIAAGPDDSIYVAFKGGIERFDPEGNLKGILNTGVCDAFAVDPSGFVYLVSDGSLRKFTSDGILVKTWAANSGPLAVDSAGDVFIADTWNSYIRKYTPEGVFITGWGEQGSGDGQFLSITVMTVDSAGNVYVADLGNNRVQKFSRFWVGNISVTSDPPGFPIYLDNVDTSHYTPYVFQNILPGLHTITLKEYTQQWVTRAQEQQVVVHANETINASFIMKPTLSVKLVTTPEPVAPGGTFSFDVLVNYNGHGIPIDYSNTFIKFDPTYITVDYPFKYPCLFWNGDEIYCGSGLFGFGETFNENLFRIPGKIKDNTPIGTKIKMSVCMNAVTDIPFQNYGAGSCDDPHYITVAEQNKVPEFPSSFLPVIMIIGFLGTVFYIQQTREH